MPLEMKKFPHFSGISKPLSLFFLIHCSLMMVLLCDLPLSIIVGSFCVRP